MLFRLIGLCAFLLGPSASAEPKDALQGHKARLDADIAELNLLMEKHRSHEWLPTGYKTILQMKEDSLYHIEQARRRLEQGAVLGKDQKLETVQDAQVFTGSHPDPMDKALKAESHSTRGVAEPGYFSAPPPVHVKAIHQDPEGVDWLQELGDEEIQAFIAAHTPAPAAGEKKPSREEQAEALIKELGKKGGEERARRAVLKTLIRGGLLARELPKLPYLSRAVELAQKKNGTWRAGLDGENGWKTRSSLEKLIVVLSSAMLSEIYVEPEVLSPTWQKDKELHSVAMLTEEEIAKQIAHQQTLVSKEDQALSKEARVAKWNAVRAPLLAAYHTPEYRKAAAFTRKYDDYELRELDAFWAKLGKKPPSTLPPSVDLSEQFREPRLQGDTNSCVAFSLISEMETFGTPVLSPGFAYGITQATEVFTKEVPSPLLRGLEIAMERRGDQVYKLLDKGTTYHGMVTALRHHGTCEESSFPFKEEGWIPRDLNPIFGRNFAPKESTEFTGRLNEQLLKQILASGVAPTVFTSYNARSIQEDWIRPEPLSFIGHASNVVGYGTAIDPFDLKKKTYFLVRDSFTTKNIHYRVAADELLPLIQGVYKITGVERLEKDRQYTEDFAPAHQVVLETAARRKQMEEWNKEQDSLQLELLGLPK